MLKLIVRRLLWAIPVLFVVALAAFLMMQAIPGSPWDKDPARMAMSNLSMDDTSKQLLNRNYGLDKPLWQQFVRYFLGYVDENGKLTCGAVCGNFGPSLARRGLSVNQVLFSPSEGKPFYESALGYSLRLGGLALLFATGIGMPAGVVAALRRNSWIDHLINLAATLSLSVPNFVTGLLLIVLLVMSGQKLIAVAPKSWSAARLEVWIVPALILGLGAMASVARLMRASMLEVMHHDYVRTARAKGLAKRVVVSRHVVRNALIPVITMLGPALAELVIGSFVIEMMFGFPGIGRLYVESIRVQDYPMVLGLTLIYAMFVVLINLGVDFVYGLLDPRIRLG